MRKRLGPFLFFGGISIAFAAIGVAMGLDFWIAFSIAVVAVLVNGVFAALEDDLPGGSNNPDGTDTPKYVKTVAWSVRAVGIVCLLIIAVFVGFWAYG